MDSALQNPLEATMKILVVEDDPSVAKTLQILISSYHYAVDMATDGEAGLRMADAFDYDLIVLDIWLPRLDGVNLCQQLRAKGFKMPILLVTAQDGAKQKANALNAGADDYVVKPFDSEELLARVQALLRRGGTKTQPILTWGPLSVDPSSRSVIYSAQLLSLTPKEYAILELFLRNARQVFNARAILDQVWSSAEAPGEDSARAHIKGLRKKLKAAGAPEDFIKTIYHMGYRLNPQYAVAQTSQTDEPLTALQIAELKAEHEALLTRETAASAAPANLEQKDSALEDAQPLTEPERQHLQARNAELEQQVAELSAALVEAHRQLQQQDQEQKLESLSQRAREIVHDLNNIFTPILASAQALRLTQKGLNATAQGQLKLLEKNAKRGANLVKELLTLRPERNAE